MTAPARLLAFADHGRIIWDEVGRVSGVLAKLQGQRIRVTIEKQPITRNLKQNALLWVTYTKAAAQIRQKVYREGLAGMEEYTGHSTREIHEAMKELYCPEKPVVLPGGRTVLVKSTRLLTVEEMSDFQMRCMADFAQHGIVVGDEEEVSV